MTLFSVSTTPSLPGLVRRHLSPHLKFSPCPRWCASSNKEFLLLCQPLPLLLCRSNSPSSSERYRPQRRRGHPDPGSPKKVTGFFFTAGCHWKKTNPLFSLPPATRQDMTFLLRRGKVWQSLNRTLLSAACQLPSYTENPEAAFEGQCIFLLHWILPSCWHLYSDIFSKLSPLIPAIQLDNVQNEMGKWKYPRFRDGNPNIS